ncbi:Cathepsin_B [Hexamita inflata]|uniref:Cathepsin B n=1 Tax=Hexamita inflata TaxID=28002 RepID=A0AA86TKG9_9EUKA|nr:Cathepsin B [Hexamita inflata]
MIGLLSLQTVNLESQVEILRNIPGLQWTPGISSFLQQKSPAELERLFKINSSQLMRRPNTFKQSISSDVPDFLDWSKSNPHCVDFIRDMKNCETSQVFASISVLSDLRCIKKQDSNRVQYSEQFVINCNQNGNECAQVQDHFIPEFLIEFGSVSESCQQLKSNETGKGFKCSYK